mmetsp:Transcript_13933/g.28246  ORF Transcript_13933/g.28246 Transcript_13933/m.28246 type:complete len:130 (+) Transcript_13933:105-494(+)|eukprot:CAMPEP_0119058268 /NCGR_PEP_ID=MMETSP1178-20130426/2634_1 /TAXON_ID=33656 /ORGANISM="unid sp, Strain CCMP2000" /LENGTH=129 /DNA_ID=CAMNT_0007039183 /DNA_START=105 /DNA_END=494 /DNA_ORIENTATION=-
MLSGLTGTASLAEELDKKLMLVLRDGRKIIGIMRSFDQFSNIVLEHAEERVVVGKCFADVPLGLYVIRGENLVLLGQIDDAKEEVAVNTLMQRVPIEEILMAKKEEAERQKLKAKLSKQINANDLFDLE